ncbi:Rha family transcriptional regulator [Shewanella algae]|uniref:Rha family transcriptional regulator n=1 Tax=Shewanella algae TaxID=38313 RepID=UPI0019817FD9|nr:Rha family transcriptional regulator [Shewanella algae]
MSTQVSINNVPTMSSREIAELTGKTHANVCRDIRNMLAQLGADQISFESVYLDAKGEKRKEYSLPRRECEILVCGYDVVRRAAVIDRWLELETKQRQLPNMTPAQMIAAIAQQQADQEAALLGVKQTQIEQGERLAEIEHKVASRGCKPGYLLITDAKCMYGRNLSAAMFRKVLEYYEVNTEAIYINTFRGSVLTTQVEEAALASVIEEFYSDLKQVTPQRYSHPAFGCRRFQA